MNVLNTFEDKQKAREIITEYRYIRRNGSVVAVRTNKYDLYQKRERIIASKRLEIKLRYIDEYLRRCVAIQLLVNEYRKDKK